ncbi:DUF1653 domain-containing protein [Rheinheimera baltica]|uniref:DUF1653 domain-containing protein n=1 Tax=Rheinheimera baltica TaxID=67576 RepID=A0ABT9I0V7_9GAMM|nr:DUF1653 domain-containing protein [Rheinheimera baltica]MDP5137020.1 DUF1653 domain-containing protein [Rheinheimera baltica]MDP5144147.1 DUF1653 domain-containing protein [Rheinheimera baltica]MDP5148967.1 DUF1653 domain-containing protein [Rheinheimera baltica]MDP5189471.1 DUF1653 domain-containing protein [Rheinheimera baltica]
MSNSNASPVQSGYYQHYKGRYYQVIDCARHSETEQWLVIYRALYGDFGLWARPAEMFNEHVEIAGELLARFQYIGDTKPDSITQNLPD